MEPIEEEQEINDDIKQKLIIKICKEMIGFELGKTIIKNVCDNINETVFDVESKIKETKDIYVQLIMKSNY